MKRGGHRPMTFWTPSAVLSCCNRQITQITTKPLACSRDKNFFCLRSAKNFILGKPETGSWAVFQVGPGRGVVEDKEGRSTGGNGLGKMNLTKAQPRSSEDHGPFLACD